MNFLAVRKIKVTNWDSGFCIRKSEMFFFILKQFSDITIIIIIFYQFVHSRLSPF